MGNRRVSQALKLAFAVGVLGTTALRADVVVLNNGGRQIEGTIIEDNPDAVTVQTATSNLRITRSQIKEIIRSSVAADGDEHNGDLMASQEQWQKALEYYQKAQAGGKASAQLPEKIKAVQEQLKKGEQAQEDHLLKAPREALKAGQYDAAIGMLKNLIATSSSSPILRQHLTRELARVHYQHALALEDAVRKEMARQELQEAARVDPTFRLAYLEWAELLAEDGYAKEAKEKYAKGFSLTDPPLTPSQESHFRNHWAELQFKSEEYEAALSNYNKILQLAPREYTGLVNQIVQVNIKLGEKLRGKNADESIKALQSAIEADPKALQARFLLGQIQFDNKRYTECIATLKALLEFDPSYKQANYLMAQAYLAAHQVDNYRFALEREIQADPSNYEAMCELGEHLLDGAQNQRALSIFQQAIKVNDGAARAYYGEIEALRKLKMLDKAEAEARDVAGKDPTNPEGITKLGQVLADVGKLEEADAMLLDGVNKMKEKGDKLTPREIKILGDAYFQIGEVALKGKNSNKAYDNFKKSLEYKPKNPAAYHGMATALLESKRLPEAEDCYIQALEQKPDEPEYYLGLGILYHNYYGRPKDALPFYEKYLELGGPNKLDVERWIISCGGKPGMHANINVADLARIVRERRAAMHNADQGTTGTLTMNDGATTGTLSMRDALTTGTLGASIPASLPLK